jgi:hypothetical protein
MLPRLLRFLAAVVLIFSLSLPFAAGQTDSSFTIERGVKVDKANPSGDDGGGSSPHALAYVALTAFTLLIMTIVCMPSRKA